LTNSSIDAARAGRPELAELNGPNWPELAELNGPNWPR
jgi:hypothetical protein